MVSGHYKEKKMKEKTNMEIRKARKTHTATSKLRIFTYSTPMCQEMFILLRNQQIAHLNS